MVLLAAPFSAGAQSESKALAALGAEPLPGRTGLEVGDAVMAVLAGAPEFDEAKPYVLVTASGVGRTAAMAAAAALADVELGRSVIVALVPSGASVGELVEPSRLAAVVDLSGAASGDGNRLAVAAVGSSPVWTRILEQSNVPVGLDLELAEAPDLERSVVLGLFERDVPGLEIASPADAASGAEAERVARFVALVVSKASRLEEAPLFSRREVSAAESSPAVARIYTGTIPDYAADVEGLRLSGVIPDGPAAAAGLAAGDVIVALGERVIADVYEYAEALDELAVDEPVTVVYLRDGERRETTLTPIARP